ncbi:hypothetical protein ACRALDRAFT_206275 [Sodiomyces alcalophilus JCM 7366]|uniref:uncharacterized protein n=1 Tax=Sodiomyces alcalophilus JCM 7366 TaxID=591952 RepID=UPI0039B69033
MDYVSSLLRWPIRYDGFRSRLLTEVESTPRSGASHVHRVQQDNPSLTLGLLASSQTSFAYMLTFKRGGPRPTSRSTLEMDSLLPTHLAYLSDAAHLLRGSAPETSAYLMSRRNEVMFAHGVERTEYQRLHVCGCCGHIMVPGQGTTLTIEATKAFRKQKKRHALQAKRRTATATRTSEEKRRMRQVIQCGNCHRDTTLFVPKLARGVRHSIRARGQNKSKAADVVESKQTAASQAVTGKKPMEKFTPASSVAARAEAGSKYSTPTAGATAATATKANASSKKRAKQRKAGLQALLNQAQSSTSRNLSKKYPFNFPCHVRYACIFARIHINYRVALPTTFLLSLSVTKSNQVLWERTLVDFGTSVLPLRSINRGTWSTLCFDGTCGSVMTEPLAIIY